MSGYRTLHRIQPHPSTPSLWHVRFSPSLRLLAAGASDQIRIYSLRERTQSNASDALDATPLIVECVECLVPTDYVADSNCVLGYGALDVVRNYCGADMYAGNEVVIASRLGGRVGVWVRLDPALNATKQVEPSSTTVDGMTFIRPDVEFTVPNATGTTCAIRPPSMANYYSDEKDLLIAMGCADGSVLLCRSGILAAKPGKTIGSAGIVGDSSSFTRQVIDIASNSTPGQVITTVGGGHACVLSIVWHPSLPDTFVVGRKDGAVDIYSSQYGMFRRVHRLMDANSPVRGLAFSRPAGALLFVGDDGGALYSYDASVMSTSFSEYKDVTRASTCPIPLVACALTAHKGWIMNLVSFTDERRVCSCGSDGSVKVWDCGRGLPSGVPVHSFDGVHGGWVWDVACGSVESVGGVGNGGNKVLLVSCGNDGVMQVFSCGD